MKAKITAEEMATLGSSWEPHYKQQGDGSFVLNVEGGFLDFEDPSKLKNALEHERKARAELGERLKSIEDLKSAEQLEAEKLASEEKAKADALAIKNKDLESITASFNEKLEQQNAEFAKQLAERDKANAEKSAAIKTSLIKQQAENLAQEIFGDLAPTQIANLLPRLDINEANEVVARTESGETMDISGFKQEILDSPLYQPIIVASKASGAGGTHDPGSPVDIGSRSFDDLSSDEKVKLHRTDPTKYNTLRDTSKQDQNTVRL